MDSVTLENYITRYGWTYERFGDVVVSGLETATGGLLVAFQFNPPWLRLSIPAYLSGQARSADFYALLLQLNERSRIVRFALGEDGQIVLCVDLYTEPSVEYSQFQLALDVLTYIADTAMPHLMVEEDKIKEQGV